MDAEITTNGWYRSLVDDCQAIVTEAVFNSRWELIVGYHALGKRITTDEDYQRHANGNGKILSRLSQDTNVSERNLYRAMQFYSKYPDLEKLPGGKNVSWNKIVNELLSGDEASGHPGKTVETCFKNLESEIRYIQKHYPDWMDSMWSLLMGLR